MKKTWTALLLTGALLFAPTTASANNQAFIDVTNATQNAIVTKIADANIMGAYYDGKFWPEEAVTRGELADIITRAYKLYNVRPAKQFNDVTEDTDYADSIQQLYRAGIIDGTADGDFNPYDEVKRTHVAKILTNLLKLTPTTTTKFKDVPKSDANNGYIGALVAKGIIAGYPDGTFKPNQFVTRMNIATFMYRALYGKEQQIANKKITSNLAYAATKLKAANYNIGTSTHYMEFDKTGNSVYKFNQMMQTFTKEYAAVFLDSTDWIISDIDLRNLVEFKPQTRKEYLFYDEFVNSYLTYSSEYNMEKDPPPTEYTLIPYFNQIERINGKTYTNVVKIVQTFISKDPSDGSSYNNRVYYFKEGFGLLKMTIDDETAWAIRSYTLR